MQAKQQEEAAAAERRRRQYSKRENIIFLFDKLYYDKGLSFVSGVDEAGAGPVAGPVVAAAVILPKDIVIDGVNDSKNLPKKKERII
jgi:ribonuclease HII